MRASAKPCPPGWESSSPHPLTLKRKASSESSPSTVATAPLDSSFETTATSSSGRYALYRASLEQNAAGVLGEELIRATSPPPPPPPPIQSVPSDEQRSVTSSIHTNEIYVHSDEFAQENLLEFTEFTPKRERFDTLSTQSRLDPPEMVDSQYATPERIIHVRHGDQPTMSPLTTTEIYFVPRPIPPKHVHVEFLPTRELDDVEFAAEIDESIAKLSVDTGDPFNVSNEEKQTGKQYCHRRYKLVWAVFACGVCLFLVALALALGFILGHNTGSPTNAQSKSSTNSGAHTPTDIINLVPSVIAQHTPSAIVTSPAPILPNQQQPSVFNTQIQSSPSASPAVAKNPAPTLRTPTLEPLYLPPTQELTIYNEIAPYAPNPVVILTRHTPQHSALKWLALERNVTAYVSPNLVQRFAMATLYLSFNASIPWLIQGQSECSWFSDSPTPCQGTSFRALSLSAHNLQGTLPPELTMMSDLRVLDFSKNQLQGTLPTFIGGLVNLNIVMLQSNQFTGQVPSEWSNLTLANIVRVDDNLLQGTVAQSLCNIFATAQTSFYSDCGGSNPAVVCPSGTCCTYCCTSRLQQGQSYNTSFVSTCAR
jgi:hypothetical protein